MGFICHQGAAASLVGTSQGSAGVLEPALVPAAASLRIRSASVSQKTARVSRSGPVGSGWGQCGAGVPTPPCKSGRKMQESN